MAATVLDTTIACLESFLRPKKISVDGDTSLYGKDGLFDSINLVAFLMELEQRLAEAHSLRIRLVSDRALSQKNSPFRSVSALVQFIAELRE
jgi:acyl carrier protein